MPALILKRHSAPLTAVETARPEVAGKVLDHGASRIDGLSWPHGKLDPVVRQLGQVILPTIEKPEHLNASRV
jgi:hypothetical protein